MVKHFYPDGSGIFSGWYCLFRPWMVIERKIMWIIHHGWRCHHLSTQFSILVWQWEQHAPQLRAKHWKIDSLKRILVLMHLNCRIYAKAQRRSSQWSNTQLKDFMFLYFGSYLQLPLFKIMAVSFLRQPQKWKCLVAVSVYHVQESARSCTYPFHL